VLYRRSGQLIQQRLGLLEVARIEPSVNRPYARASSSPYVDYAGAAGGGVAKSRLKLANAPTRRSSGARLRCH
jgi:hypothetical protein